MQTKNLVKKIMASYAEHGGVNREGAENLPNRANVVRALRNLQALIFPGFKYEERITEENLQSVTERHINEAVFILTEEIQKALLRVVIAAKSNSKFKKSEIDGCENFELKENKNSESENSTCENSACKNSACKKKSKSEFGGCENFELKENQNCENANCTLEKKSNCEIENSACEKNPHKKNPAQKNECGREEKFKNSHCFRLAQNVAEALIAEIPELRKKITLDAQAILEGDPAARSLGEVILSYPGLGAITVYRIAHFLHVNGVPIIPRIMSEHAHGNTGIDIHPGAQIGERFFIDHGTGIVIGETAVIGNNVKIYQGVTLGALSVKKELQDKKRHPTIEDDVTIYANATILGGKTVIGKGSTIGGNTWVVSSVAAGSYYTNS